MGLLKFIDRLKQIDHLIKTENTGSADEFAEKLGISRSMLMINLEEMRTLGAEIVYCPHKRSYRYAAEFNVIIGNPAATIIEGGASHLIDWYRRFFPQSNGIGHLSVIFAP